MPSQSVTLPSRGKGRGWVKTRFILTPGPSLEREGRVNHSIIFCIELKVKEQFKI